MLCVCTKRLFSANVRCEKKRQTPVNFFHNKYYNAALVGGVLFRLINYTLYPELIVTNIKSKCIRPTGKLSLACQPKETKFTALIRLKPAEHTHKKYTKKNRPWPQSCRTLNSEHSALKQKCTV